MYELVPDDRSLAYTTSGCAAFEHIVQRESLDGSKVLLPAFIFRDGFHSIFERYDLEPVFVDVDPTTYHLDFEEAGRHLESVDATLLVHAFGLPANADRWVERCRRQGVLLIEDCARALGASHEGRPVGSFGDYAIFSLWKVSPLFTGGCVVSADPDARFDFDDHTINLDLLAKVAYYNLSTDVSETVASLYEAVVGDRNYTRDPVERDGSEADTPRTVQQLDPLHRLQFERYVRRDFPRELSRQRSVADALRSVLESYGFDVHPDDPDRVYYKMPATAPGSRDELRAHLEARGIDTYAIWDEPWGLIAEAPGSDTRYPVTAELAERIVQFPIPDMSLGDVRRVDEALRAFYGVRKRVTA